MLLLSRLIDCSFCLRACSLKETMFRGTYFSFVNDMSNGFINLPSVLVLA